MFLRLRRLTRSSRLSGSLLALPPDVAKNKATGEVKFKEINEAYEVLGDPEKRKRYDELGMNWQDEPGMSEHPGAGRGRSARTPPNMDFEFGGTGFSDFFESFFGSGRNARGPSGEHGYPRGDDGRGYSEPGRDVEADIMVTLEEALKGSRRKVTLRRSGEDGEAVRSDTYQVRIPAGVHEGQRIRLAGRAATVSGEERPGTSTFASVWPETRISA